MVFVSVKMVIVMVEISATSEQETTDHLIFLEREVSSILLSNKTIHRNTYTFTKVVIDIVPFPVRRGKVVSDLTTSFILKVSTDNKKRILNVLWLVLRNLLCPISERTESVVYQR